jgi:hypothetical protein
MENAVVLAHKHFDRAVQNHAALVKGVFVSPIFPAGFDPHADHNQIVPDHCLAGDAGPKFFQLQCVWIPKGHVKLLASPDGFVVCLFKIGGAV